MDNPQNKPINKAGMILYGILGIPAGAMLGVIAIFIAAFAGAPDMLIGPVFFGAMLLVVVAIAYKGAKSPTRAEAQAELEKNATSMGGLSTNEKILIWILSFINPIIIGAVFYYIWRTEYPNKAKAANKISITVFFIWTVLGILSSVLSN